MIYVAVASAIIGAEKIAEMEMEEFALMILVPPLLTVVVALGTFVCCMRLCWEISRGEW